MLKLAGGVCVLLGAAVLGSSAAARLRSRVRVLTQLIDGLMYLEEELSFRLTPLPVILSSLSRQKTGRVGDFFNACLEGLRAQPLEGVRASWRQAAEAHLDILRDEERDAVLILGSTLGQYDGEGQRQSLEQSVERLKTFRQRAEEERARLGKVYTAVSLAAGAMVVIVLA